MVLGIQMQPLNSDYLSNERCVVLLALHTIEC